MSLLDRPEERGGGDSGGAQLADNIAQDIVAAGAKSGDVVGSEAQLMVQYAVGRPVFRQAARILTERGVAYMRRGNNGGLVVAQPSADFAGRGLSIVIGSLTKDLRPLSLLPLAVDNHLFLHGVRGLSLEKCQELRRLARRLDRLSEDEFLAVGAHRQLHQAIRTASTEPAIALANKAATEYIVDLMPYSIDVMMEGSKGEAWRLTFEAAEALVAGDIPRLFECQRRQVQIIEESWPQWDAIERDPSRSPKITPVEHPELRGAANQAERLAREILREMRLRDWKAGERIGGGAELMARYGASATILRQAVRNLQEHAAVDVERGRNGGLFIATPDRALAVNRAQVFLRQSGAGAVDVEAFLVQLLLGAMDSARRPSEADLRGAAGSREGLTLGTLASAMARAAGSPPLDIFVEVLSPFLPARPSPLQAPQALLQELASSDRVLRRRALLACLNRPEMR